MTEEKKNVPALRFPEFSEEWEDTNIEHVVNVYDGTHQTPKYTSEGIKFLSVENIKTLKTSKFISKEAFEKEFKVYPQFGDVLMTRIGDVGTPKFVNTHEELAYYVSLALLKPKNIHSYFLEALILSPTIQSEIWRRTLHIAFPKKINKNEIGKVRISIPESKEQNKIGDFFSKLDRQIELEEERLALLEAQKKGYMQKIFSQELRFKDDDGNDYPEWEEKKLSDLGSYSKSYSFSRDVEGEGKVHHIHYGDIHSKLPSKICDINLLPTIKESKDFEFLQKGDIIFADASEDYKDLGKAIMVDIDEDNIIAGLHTHVFRPNLQIVSEFLMYYTKTLNYFKFIKRQGTGISVLGISKKNLSNFILGLPERREQQKIGDFFSKLDSQIDLQKQKIECLKQRKKGLIQKMFV